MNDFGMDLSLISSDCEMSLMDKVPSYEQFVENVKENYLGFFGEKDRKKAEEYFESEEAVEHLKVEYNRSKIEFLNGEITLRQFLEGGASSVGYCLWYMF